MTITLVVISDTHALHRRLRVPPGDILIHAGDLTNDGSLAQVADVNAWLGTLPHPHKVFIAGNHDHCFERWPEEARALLTNATYLENEACIVAGLHIYGSPVTPWFCDLAFNVRRGTAIRAVWDQIPANIDVLVTHGPPAGIGDRTSDGRHVGCADLLAVVERIQPHVHCFGHIHEASGIATVGATTFVNASVCGVYERVTFPARVVALHED